jgi:hypothetical protein
MKLKNGEIVIPYTLRRLVMDKAIQGMVGELNEKKNAKGPISVYLPLANDQMNRICENQLLCEELGGFDSCFNLDDSLLISELTNIGVLSHTANDNSYGWNDEDSSLWGMEVNSPEFIEHLFNWVRDKDLILNYGIFSLHTFTGEAYCMDNRYDFDTSKGLFRVFRAFLEEPAHILSYIQIHNLFYEESITEASKAKFINQTIGEIREKLKMTTEFSKLLIPADKKYLLRAS